MAIENIKVEEPTLEELKYRADQASNRTSEIMKELGISEDALFHAGNIELMELVDSSSKLQIALKEENDAKENLARAYGQAMGEKPVQITGGTRWQEYVKYRSAQSKDQEGQVQDGQR